VFDWHLAGGSGHSDAVVAVDAEGNVAALLHTINTGTWGRTGIVIDGVSIADAASFQQGAVARAGPGGHIADPTNPLIVLRNGKPVLVSSSIDMGLHEATLQSILNVLEFDLDPKAAVDTSHFYRPVFAGSEDGKGELKPEVGSQIVAEGEFSPGILEAVRAMGGRVSVLPVPAARGWKGGWVGITIDPATGQLRGAAPRYYNGWALGY
jgi:gamma-glutamyltranspeptidase/glutathione hydrolase